MLEAYLDERMDESAVFSLFVRRLPAERNFLLACGLDTVLSYLETLRFEDDDIAYLASLGRFSRRFLDWLRAFRFSGDVYAVPEGTPIFANEPILEVIAPIAQAQLIETFVMNQIHLQTVLASKAARVVAAARGRPVIDFGPRRMHGIDAALKAARAFFIGGVAATSNVLAGERYGVPVAGTMAHSYVQAHDDEAAAFRAFARLYPETVILVDTYDTLAGVRKVIELVRGSGGDISDRGDPPRFRRSRGAFPRSAPAPRRSGAPEHPHLRQRRAGRTRDRRRSSHRARRSIPSGSERKWAYRATRPISTSPTSSPSTPAREDSSCPPTSPFCRGASKCSASRPKAVAVRDVIGRWTESLPGRPLLRAVMRNGVRLPDAQETLGESRKRADREIASLPLRLRALEPADPPYPVEVSNALLRLSSGGGEGGAPRQVTLLGSFD